MAKKKRSSKRSTTAASKKRATNRSNVGRGAQEASIPGAGSSASKQAYAWPRSEHRDVGFASAEAASGFAAGGMGQMFTGCRLVVLRERGMKRVSTSSDTLKRFQNLAGKMAIAETGDFEDDRVDLEQVDGALLLQRLGVLVTPEVDESAVKKVAAESGPSGRYRAFEPEMVMSAIGMWPTAGPWSGGGSWPGRSSRPAGDSWPGDRDAPAHAESSSASGSGYLDGYRDAVADLTGRLAGVDSDHAAVGLRATRRRAVGDVFEDSDDATWGVQAVNAAGSHERGEGVKVAVLDTGMDLDHPDFRDREIVARAFVPGETAEDAHGHGTHCTGTACGPAGGAVPGYGVASNASIFVGKVLSDQGFGRDRGILAGIEWALSRGCRVISLSLGGRGPVSRAYTEVGRAALENGALIVAAAGNDSRRPGEVIDLARPANSPTIMAVAAVDRFLRVAWFSNGSTLNRGAIDVAGPGVGVISSMPGGYQALRGTSMATPHVAGVAALYAAHSPASESGSVLWRAVVSSARRLAESSADAGVGLTRFAEAHQLLLD